MSVMKSTNFISVLTILGILLMIVQVQAGRIRVDSGGCEDTAKWCRKLGRKIPLSRCYDLRHRERCCATCEKLKLPIAGCEYGDRDAALCHSIDRSRPVGDCYAFNSTCCQTCHLLDSGIPGCPFGDRVTWCSGIGDRYLVSSCYDHEIHCCDTCRQFRTGIPGDENPHITRCPYGDRLLWCAGIGDIYPISYCEENAETCCESCNRFRDVHKSQSTTQAAELSVSISQDSATPKPTVSSKTGPNSISQTYLDSVTASKSWRHSSASPPSSPAVTINTVLTDTLPWQLHLSNHSGLEVPESQLNISTKSPRTTTQVPETVNKNIASTKGRVESGSIDSGLTRDIIPGSSDVNKTFSGTGHNYSRTVTKEVGQTSSTPSGVKIYTADSSDTTSDNPRLVSDGTHLKTHLNEISLEDEKTRHNEAISQGVSSGSVVLHSGSLTENLLLVMISLACSITCGLLNQIHHTLWR